MPGAARRLDFCLGRHQKGGGDPSHRRVGKDWFRTSVTPAGPVLLQLSPAGADVVATVWGDGSAWALQQVPRLLGAHDSWDGFAPPSEGFAAMVKHSRHLLIGATDLIAETLPTTVIEQKVTSAEAFRAIGGLMRRHGSPAPGPAGVPGHAAHGMLLPPTAEQWARIPSWQYLNEGVEDKRARALVGGMQRASALQRLTDRVALLPSPEAGVEFRAGLESLPGIGAWTSARVAQLVVGDPDAWSIGDYHIPGHLSLALVGRRLGDAETDALLEPYRPHRFRVEIMLMRHARGVERHGPRRTLPSHLGW